MACRLNRTDALRFDIKPAQAQKLGFRVFQHRLEALAGIVRAAFQHGRLRFQKFYKRLLIGIQQLARLLGHAARGLGIARTGSDQAGRKRLISTVALAGAKMAAQRIRRLDDAFHQPPQKQDRRHDSHDTGDRRNQRHIIVVARKNDIQFTGTISQPGKAETKGHNDQQIE